MRSIAALLFCLLALAGCPRSGDESRKDGEPTPTPYHPAGYENMAVHGMEAKFQEQACASCHGERLEGAGNAVSCDSCHPAGWRTNCTFCHGAVENDTGAPPLYIDGTTDSERTAFTVHDEHVTPSANHAAFDCVQCHVKPEDVLSPGHLFVQDTSAGTAEVTFLAGLSPDAAWSGEGCSALYCHGSGLRSDGAIEADAGDRACDSCHPNQSSGAGGWETMSGRHELHLDEGFVCSECHASVVSGGTPGPSGAAGTIVSPERHVDGIVENEFPSGMVFDDGSCTGVCHGEGHDGREW